MTRARALRRPVQQTIVAVLLGVIPRRTADATHSVTVTRSSGEGETSTVDTWTGSPSGLADRIAAALDTADQEKNTDGGTTAPEAAFTPDTTSLIVYRAGYHGELVPLGWYTNPEAAQQHCRAQLSSEYAGAVTVTWDWRRVEPEYEPDPLDPLELIVQVDGGEEEPTGYVVTPLLVAEACDPDADA